MHIFTCTYWYRSSFTLSLFLSIGTWYSCFMLKWCLFRTLSMVEMLTDWMFSKTLLSSIMALWCQTQDQGRFQCKQVCSITVQYTFLDYEPVLFAKHLNDWHCCSPNIRLHPSTSLSHCKAKIKNMVHNSGPYFIWNTPSSSASSTSSSVLPPYSSTTHP